MPFKFTQPLEMKFDQLCDMRMLYLYGQQFCNSTMRAALPINRSVRDSDTDAAVAAAVVRASVHLLPASASVAHSFVCEAGGVR